MSLQVTHPSRLYLTLSLTVVIFQLCLLFLSYFFVPVFSSVLLSDSFSTFLFDVSIFYISLPLCLFLWIPPVFYSGPVRLPGLTSAFTLSLFFLNVCPPEFFPVSSSVSSFLSTFDPLVLHSLHFCSSEPVLCFSSDSCNGWQQHTDFRDSPQSPGGLIRVWFKDCWNH